MINFILFFILILLTNIVLGILFYHVFTETVNTRSFNRFIVEYEKRISELNQVIDNTIACEKTLVDQYKSGNEKALVLLCDIVQKELECDSDVIQQLLICAINKTQ